MQIDRKKFFDGFRARLDSTIEQEQVDGLNFLLGAFESEAVWADVRHIAYALATIFHETAQSFQPVVEGYYLAETDPPDYAGKTKRVKNFQKGLRYFPYFGRGYVQLTWKQNYDKAGKAIGVDLVGQPELALEPETAFKVLTLGLFRGWFGGRLTTYINDKKTDYEGARHCVNGTDKAGLIAGYARSFEKILRSSVAGSTDAGTGDAQSGGSTSQPAPVGDPADPQKQPPTQQIAENIINAGDPPSPPPEDKTLAAPAKDGATANSAKMVIAGVVVPPFIAGILKAITDLIQQGFVDAHDVGSFLLDFLRDNIKWVLLLVGLLIVLLIVKKIIKTVTFWLEMISHMVPKFNNVTVVPSETQPAKRWWQF